jgi:chloramphenicol 3-O-phosphotransferase
MSTEVYSSVGKIVYLVGSSSSGKSTYSSALIQQWWIHLELEYVPL